MILLFPGKAQYKIGGDFPLLQIPLDMPNSKTESLEDFQWWAYSEDFKKWLDANPRQWVADSLDNSVYHRSLSFINEHDNEKYRSQKMRFAFSSFDDYVSALEEASVSSNKSDEKPEISADEAFGREAVKFHFAYNKLLSDGKIKDSLEFSSLDEGQEIAVFILVEDPQTGENITETLKAFKMSPMKSGGDGKIVMVKTTETLPGGPLPENSTSESIFNGMVQDGFKLAAYSAAAVAAFSIIKWVGGGFALRGLLKTVQKFNPRYIPARPSRGILTSATKGIKGLWGGVKSLATLKTTRTLLKDASDFVKIGRMYRSGNVASNFMKGLSWSMKGGARGGSKLIPFVGEVLLVVDAIGSAWNWYSNNQAPRYGELEDYPWIKDSFDPKSVEIGKPLTICWSQPAGGTWGGVVGFLFNNETRTTMELVKIAENKGESIFILTQINSKEIQKQIAEHELTLVSFDNSDVVERGYIDNEDLDFKISFVDGISKIASQYNFQGYCSWDELISEFNRSPDQLVITDPLAPEEFAFNFKDSEENVINVFGKKVSDQALSKYTDQDFVNLFGLDRVKSEFTPSSAKSSASAVSEYRSQVIGFNDFHNLNLFEDAQTNPQKSTSPKGETPGDVDAQSSGLAGLTPEQKSEPAKIAIYLVTNKEYANPQLRGKFGTGKFTNFLIDPSEYTAQDESSIEVDINTDEVLNDAKVGTFTYTEEPEIKEPRKKEEEEPETNQETDEEKPEKEDKEEADKDYYVETTPDDVSIKNKRHSLIIRDKSSASGVNIFDEFLTDKDKEILNIENWKSITSAKEIFDNRGDVIKVKFWNRYAPWGDRKRIFTATDGEKFELAKKFAEEVKDRIKYD